MEALISTRRAVYHWSGWVGLRDLNPHYFGQALRAANPARNAQVDLDLSFGHGLTTHRPIRDYSPRHVKVVRQTIGEVNIVMANTLFFIIVVV
jgi:hypothetical protein